MKMLPVKAEPRLPGPGVSHEPGAGHCLGNHRSRRRAADAPSAHHHEQQIQDNVQNRRAAQEAQRHHGIPHRPQQVGEIIIQEHEGQPQEDDPHIGVHHVHQLCRNLKKPQNGTAAQHHGGVENQGGPTDEQEGELHTVLHPPLFLPPVIEGEQSPAAHAHADEDGSQECHQSVGGAHGRQSVRPQKAAYDQGVRDIIELLQQIPRNHGSCEQEHILRHVSLCQILFHLCHNASVRAPQGCAYFHHAITIEETRMFYSSIAGGNVQLGRIVVPRQNFYRIMPYNMI